MDDLQRIPPLTKQTLQQRSLTDFLAAGTDLKQCVVSRTSGSTGLPLAVCHTKHEELYGDLTLARATLANGARPWHKKATVLDPARIPKSRIDWARMRRKIYLRAGQNVEEQLEILRSFQPHVITGYSQSLKYLAHSVRQSGIKDLSPHTVFGIAELLDGSARALINEVFGVEMVDLYASIEANCIAWECPQHCGYHLNVDTLIVEFIRDGRPVKAGEAGHIVVTPLYLYAMPLIRYNLGDIGIATDRHCPCGRGLPLMEAIQGRADDFITLPSGTIIPPVGTFATVIENEPSILEYLVVQEDYDLIVVKLVMHEGYGSEEIERVKSGIENLTRHEAVAKVEVCNKIDRGSEVKLRKIVSKIPVRF